MFLSRFAEKSGLFGILAPRRRGEKRDAHEQESNNNDDDGNGADAEEDVKPTADDDVQEETSKPAAREGFPSDGKDSQENILRKRRLDAQQKAEAEAESRGAFAKKQRVKYHNKHQGRWDDAVIIGVHHDDGPDKPYYVRLYRPILLSIAPTRIESHLLS